MTLEHPYLLALGVVTIVLLALEKLPMIVAGVLLVVAVTLPGLLPVERAVSGFAHSAVVTVAALFVVGEAFLRTGAASLLAARILSRTGSSEASIGLLIMLMAAVLSAFVNNTLVVVTFLPVVTSICRTTGLAPSRLLMLLSYASILGGLCTLVGTSTNLLVSGALEEHGRPGLGMFELTPIGIVLAGVGILWLALVGRRQLPRIPSLATMPGAQELREYVMEVRIGPRSRLLNRPVRDFGAAPAVRPMLIVRDEKVLAPPFRDLTIAAHDLLVLTGPVEELTALQVAERTPAGEGDTFDPGTMSFFEVALTHTSGQIGKRVRQLRLKSEHGAVPVALQRAGHHLRDRLDELIVHAGDVLLAFGDDRSKVSLRRSPDYHLIEGVDEVVYHRHKAPLAFAIIGLVLVLFVTGVVHTCVAALIGATLMVVTGCLGVRQAQTAVNWPVLVFIGGTIALSRAMELQETDRVVGEFLASTFGGHGPGVLLVGMFLITAVLTEFLSNNAVAVIMTPIALAAAAAAGVDDRSLALAVAYAASLSFANPFAYKPNILVFGPGGYRFRDFMRVGLPLALVLWTSGALLLAWSLA